MKQWTKKEYCRMLERNGYHCSRQGKGSHSIYTNSAGIHITVGKTINPCIARRVIKENKLNPILFIYESRRLYQIQTSQEKDYQERIRWCSVWKYYGSLL